MTAEEVEQLLQTVGAREGWDFSRVCDQRDPAPWDYRTVVRQYLRLTDDVLDVGTGGGENFLALASHFGTGMGVDVDPAMITAAQRNQQQQHVDHVRFAVIAAEQLDFASNSKETIFRTKRVSPNQRRKGITYVHAINHFYRAPGSGRRLDPPLVHPC